MGRFTLAWCALWFLVGIICTGGGIAPALVLVLLGIVAAWREGRASRTRTIAFLAFACGAIDALLRGHPLSDVGDTHVRRMIATVVDEQRSALRGTMLSLRLPDGALATMEARDDPPAIGARLVVRGKREPFDTARNSGEPSERELQAERGVSWRLVEASILTAGKRIRDTRITTHPTSHAKRACRCSNHAAATSGIPMTA